MIRSFFYASLLALTTLNLAPQLASAQETARGEFTLTHEVHWKNAVVPAGDYIFSFRSDGAMGLLTLSKMSGHRSGFMIQVNDKDEMVSSGLNRLVLEDTPKGTYVSSMELPGLGMALRFPVPLNAQEKEIARGTTQPLASAQ